MNRTKTPLALQRDKLELTQPQMAVMLKTVQSEISKTEAGEMPPSDQIERWAKAYRLRVKKFRALVEAAQWALPLWKFSECRTPSEIQHIDCRREVRSA